MKTAPLSLQLHGLGGALLSRLSRLSLALPRRPPLLVLASDSPPGGVTPGHRVHRAHKLGQLLGDPVQLARDLAKFLGDLVQLGELLGDPVELLAQLLASVEDLSCIF